MVFEQIAAMAPSGELRSAIASAGDRLHAFRMIEEDVLEPMLGELDELAIRDSGQPQSIRRYHLRRMRAVPALIRARSRR